MGLHVVKHESEIDDALAGALQFDDEVLCEAFVPPGREIRFAVLEVDAASAAQQAQHCELTPATLSTRRTTTASLP